MWIEQIALVVWLGLAAWMVAGWLVRALSISRPLGTVAVSVGLIVGTCAATAAWWLWPVVSEIPHPTLGERYAESWDLGPSGARLFIDASTVLPTTVGRLQMFTPAVRSPATSALSNVWLSVCLPFEFVVEPVNAVEFERHWELQDKDRCVRYTTRIGEIPRDRGINPREVIHFRATRQGTFPVFYSISTNEFPPFNSAFAVKVVP